jgi:type II secretory pathway pseudopilin PulG
MLIIGAMKSPPSQRRPHPGLTLLEMSVVMLLLLTLIGTSLAVSRKYREWQLGREAAETLRTVYAAQRMFLSDNPTVTVSTINTAQIIPYLPTRAAVMPTVKSLTGANLPILVNVSPPIINNGSGTFYDPSSSRTDNLWDVGE